MSEKKEQKSTECARKSEECKAGRDQWGQKRDAWTLGLLFVVTCLLIVLFNYLYQRPMEEKIRNSIVISLSAGGVLYALLQAKMEHSYDYNNEQHLKRFTLLFLSCELFACIMPLLPSSTWPFLPAAVALSLFSSSYIGLLAYAVTVMSAVFLADAPPGVFFLYFVSGAVAIALFKRLDAVFRVGIPFGLSLLFLFVMETATILLFINERLTWEMFVMPCMNLFLSAILLLCVLKYFSFTVVHKYRERYLEIIDPEFPLLSEMKQKSRSSYFTAIHTAYFCDRIARTLGMDSELCKAGGYYHNLEAFFGEGGKEDEQKKTLESICRDYDFPPEVCALLQECRDRHYASKESAVVMFSDTIVSSVMYLFSRHPDVKPDYKQITDMVFQQKMDSGILDFSEITLRELTEMKEIFLKEKLYYDFLR